ncbi:14192_t:CDS:1, partial [Gigaspora margarita]
MVNICDRCNRSFKKLWMLTHHLNNKFLCKPKVLDLLPTFRTHAPKIVHTSKIPDPILQIEPDTVNPLDQVSDMKCPAPQTSQTDEHLSREEFEYLKALDLIKKDTILDT